MSWLRTDDRKVLDPVVGQLTDREYREHDALLQYVAREHRDDGVFNVGERVHVVYTTPAGARNLRKGTLAHLIALDLVQELNGLSHEYLAGLGIEHPSGTESLRPRNWEKYNPPRDGTATERQRRRRHGDVTDMSRRDNRDGHGVSHGDVTAPHARASAPVPVPSLKAKARAVKDVRTSDTLPAFSNLPDKPALLGPEIRAALDELQGK